MEALLQLEKVQRVLSLMGSRGLSDPADDGGGGDRFLAHFLLFMVQPFDSLTLEKKILLVSELLREVNSDTIEEVQHLANLEGTKGEDELDASNEDSLLLVPDNYPSAVLERKKIASTEASLSDMLDPLDNLLQCQGLMTDQLRNELKSGIQYWSLERKLCQALSRNDKISIEDVMKAIHLKSFDYRVLNLMMYQLTGQQVNELHMEFLSVSEFLVEISDDLYDYEDDVINNTFNILRMFTAIYGPLDAPKMLAKSIGEAEEKYESFSKKLDPSLSGSYWRRCEEATREGGKISSHTYGTWNIPPLIRDEESFRRDRMNKDDYSAVTIR
ncbi:hypothetical protein ACQ4PT_045524 [Festuca glaucescens]